MATTARTETPLVPLSDVEVDTLTKIFITGIDRHGGPAAMLHKEGAEWKPHSHGEVEQRVANLAAALQAMGLKKGDRAAILSENRPEWAIADYAVLCLGGADVPLYATLPPGQIAYILNDAGARIIFVSTRDQLAKILEIRADLPSLETIVAFDDPGHAEGVLRLAELETRGAERIAAGDFVGLRELSAGIARDDLATLIYTSGTTGDPKGVMLSHYNIASNVAASEQHGVFEISPGHVALSFLPLSHSFERMLDYYYWFKGATIAYVDAVDKVGEAMTEVQPHVVAAAPRVFEKIYGRVMGATGVKGKLVGWAKKVGEAAVEDRLSGRRPEPTGLREKLADRLVFSKLRERTGARVLAFVSGSAPLSADIAKFFWAAGLPVYEGYGLTETSPVLSVNRPGAVRLGSVGLPLPGTEIRIAPDGEILVRGPQVMQGYFGSPEATAEIFDEDGWLHTGDVGVIDEDGFLWITDRIKNIIVTAGGKNVAPAPIENAAALSPFVSQVVMIGDKRPFPSLLVVPDFEYLAGWAREQGIDAADTSVLVRDPRVHEAVERDTLARLASFARYEVPKKIALVPTEFTVETGEITPTLKVKRKVVENRYERLIEEIYSEG
jgi:long-chain acyl-CoA synthetase